MPVIKIVPMPGPQGPAGNGSGGNEFIPLPSFLTYQEGRQHLPTLNTHFGWNSNGVWFSGDAGEDASYPIFTNFTIPADTSVQVSFDVEIDAFCSDIGVCVYSDGTIPEWNFGTNSTRIAAQFDCPQPYIYGIEESATVPEGQGQVPDPGIYTVVFTYNPTAETDKVVFSYSLKDSEETIATISLNESLPGNTAYRIGFAADMDGDGPDEGGDFRTYITNLSITGQAIGPFSNSLTNGSSGEPANNIADFVFLNSGDESSMTISNHDMLIRTIRDDGQDADIDINSADDVWINANDEIEIIAGDDILIQSDTHVRIRSNNDNAGKEWDFNADGKLILPSNGYIQNPENSSGDGNGYDTLKIVPDAEREQYDQYLIIDPTQPNHIHIRAGGQQDNSNSVLILGAERTNVQVYDSIGSVGIVSKRPDTANTYENINGDNSSILAIAQDLSTVYPNGNFSVEVDGTRYVIDSVNYNSEAGVTEITAGAATFVLNSFYTIYESNGENYWAFTNDGYLSGPAMGGLNAYAIGNPGQDAYFSIYAGDKITLSAPSGEFLGDADVPNNQIATIGDIGVDTEFTVAGGTLGTQPTFDGAPLFTGSYVKTGPMVHFRIDVDFDNITSFGTGQYYVDLPLPAKYNYQFAAGCYHDISTERDYPIFGHVLAGESRLVLKSIDASGNQAYNVPFTATSPVTLNAEDNFHISGDYIALIGD